MTAAATPDMTTQDLLGMMAHELPDMAAFMRSFSKPYKGTKPGNQALQTLADNLDTLAAKAAGGYAACMAGDEVYIPFWYTTDSAAPVAQCDFQLTLPKVAEKAELGANAHNRTFVMKGRLDLAVNLSSAKGLTETLMEFLDQSHYDTHPSFAPLVEKGGDARRALEIYRDTLETMLINLGKIYDADKTVNTSYNGQPMRPQTISSPGRIVNTIVQALVRKENVDVRDTSIVRAAFHNAVEKSVRLFETAASLGPAPAARAINNPGSAI